MCSQIAETCMHVNVICDVTARYQESEHSATLAKRRKPLLVTVGGSEWELLPSDRDWKYEKACFFESRKAFQAEASDSTKTEALGVVFPGISQQSKTCLWTGCRSAYGWYFLALLSMQFTLTPKLYLSLALSWTANFIQRCILRVALEKTGILLTCPRKKIFLKSNNMETG